MTKKILVVDDDPSMVRLISQVLSSKGYEVLESNNGQDALRLLYSQKPDLVLLDVVMPVMDGWQTCSRIRDISAAIPIIMLTGQRKTEEDVAQGLDYGADEYLIKPVGNKELVARVQAMLRRAELPSSVEDQGKHAAFSDGYLTVDIAQRRVIVDGNQVKLTPIEFRLLALLLQNTGRILMHQQLLEKVWGWEYVDDLDYVRIYISHLRKKIEPNPALPKYIITEPGVGYYFQKPA
ncbi:MAG: response regulator transcription factor [Dehalococcoidia bacterium]|nr:MAG: response regulator transcription factor [Dehalococcoidia bacterium]